MGRRGRRESKDLLLTAYNAGIRYYDTARLYGHGDAERLVGEVFGSQRDVSITTKVGLGAATWNQRKAIVRRLARPIARQHAFQRDSSPQRFAVTQSPSIGTFGSEYVARSLATSMKQIGRSALDCVLLHEISDPWVTDDLIAQLADYLKTGQVVRFGIATSHHLSTDSLDRLSAVVSVVQAAAPPLGEDLTTSPTNGHTRNFHSLLGRAGHDLNGLYQWIRQRPENAAVFSEATGLPVIDKSALADLIFSYRRTQAPDDVLIFASSSSRHLTESARALSRTLPAETVAALKTVLKAYSERSGCDY